MLSLIAEVEEGGIGGGQEVDDGELEGIEVLHFIDLQPSVGHVGHRLSGEVGIGEDEDVVEVDELVVALIVEVALRKVGVFRVGVLVEVKVGRELVSTFEQSGGSVDGFSHIGGGESAWTAVFVEGRLSQFGEDFGLVNVVDDGGAEGEEGVVEKEADAEAVDVAHEEAFGQTAHDFGHAFGHGA